MRLDALLAQVADGTPPTDHAHQSTCPYCQTTLRRLRQGWDDVAALRHQPVTVPPGLTAQIMQRVRLLAAQLTDSILLTHPRGETRISHTVISRLVQRLVSAVPGVVFASVRAEPHDPPQPNRLGLSIELIATLGPALHTLADAVRQAAHRRAHRLTGAVIDQIDITITDIAEHPQGNER
jgi:hypothetical protein